MIPVVTADDKGATTMVRSRGGSEEMIVTTRKAMPRSPTVVSDTATVTSCSESSLSTTTSRPSNRTNDSMATTTTMMMMTAGTTCNCNDSSLPHCKQQQKDAIPKAISMNKTTATKTKKKTTTNARKQKPKKQHPSIIHPVLSTTSLIPEQSKRLTEEATSSRIVSVKNNDEDDVGSTLYLQLQKRLRPEDIPCIPTLERNQRRRYNPKTTTTTTTATTATTTMTAATIFTTNNNNNNYSYFRPTCTFINYFGTITKQQEQQQQCLEQPTSSTTAIPTPTKSTATNNDTTLPNSLIQAPTSTTITFDVVPIPSLDVSTTTTTADPLSFDDMEYDENDDHFGLLFKISEQDPIMLQIDDNEGPLDMKTLNWGVLQPEQQQQLEEHDSRDYFWDETFENLVPCESLVVTSSRMIEDPTTLPSADLDSSNYNLVKKPTLPPTYSSAKMKHTDAVAMVNKLPSFVGVDEFFTTKYMTCTSDSSFTQEVSHNDDDDDDDVADLFNFYT